MLSFGKELGLSRLASILIFLILLGTINMKQGIGFHSKQGLSFATNLDHFHCVFQTQTKVDSLQVFPGAWYIKN